LHSALAHFPDSCCSLSAVPLAQASRLRCPSPCLMKNQAVSTLPSRAGVIADLSVIPLKVIFAALCFLASSNQFPFPCDPLVGDLFSTRSHLGSEVPEHPSPCLVEALSRVFLDLSSVTPSHSCGGWPTLLFLSGALPVNRILRFRSQAPRPLK